MCDKFVCGRMYVTKLFEWAGGSGRADGRTGGRADGRTGGRADGRTGYRTPNKNTKMWGNIPKVLSETLLKKTVFNFFQVFFPAVATCL